MTFANPLFLIGLGAAVLPLLIHLIRRMQAKKVPFGSLMFLTATPKQVVKKRRLKDLLLLAVRTAMLLLLAFVFARPFLPEAVLPAAPSGARSVVILVDVSYSMQHGSRMAQARAEASRWIERAGRGDEIAVLAFSDVVQPLSELSVDHALARAAVGAVLRPTYRPTAFYPPLRAADDVLKDARHRRRTVVLISDMQLSGWKGAVEWKLSPGVELVPVSIGGSGQPFNEALQEVQVTPVYGDADSGIRLDARIAATGNARPARTEATLIVNGATVQRRELSPSISRLSVQHPFGRETVVQGVLSLRADGLPADDRFYFSHRVQDKPGILFIDGSNAGREAFYAGSAFEAGTRGRYTFTTSRTINRAELFRNGLVFVSDVPTPGAAGVAALREYAVRGGTVVVSFGPNTDPARYSDALKDLGIGTPLPDVVDVTASPALIGELDLRHPVFEPFGTSGASVILPPAFRHYVSIEPAADARVIGRYGNGDPFLIERTLGAGRILVYTSTLSTAWTDLPLQEMYVPLLFQLARYAFENGGPTRLFTVGGTVPLRGRPGARWEIRDPNGDVYRETSDASGEALFRKTDQPGHYVAAGGGERIYFSVNVDPTESDLAARDVEEVVSAVVDQRPALPSSPEEALLTGGPDEQREIWKPLLLLVLLLFTLESVLANRRARAAASAVVSSSRSTPHLQKTAMAAGVAILLIILMYGNG